LAKFIKNYISIIEAHFGIFFIVLALCGMAFYHDAEKTTLMCLGSFGIPFVGIPLLIKIFSFFFEKNEFK